MTYARIALRQRVETTDQHCQRGFLIQNLTQAAAVIARQMQGQIRDQMRRNGYGTGIAVTGIDAVDDPFIGQQMSQIIRATPDALLEIRIFREFQRCLALGDK